MTPVTHDSDDWKNLLRSVRELHDGQRHLENQMTNLIGTNGDGGVLGALINTVGKLDDTVSNINETMIGWRAILSDRKDRHGLWYPIIAALLAALLIVLGTMLATRAGKEAMGLGLTQQQFAEDATIPPLTR